jgi:hypothetical protein
MPPKKTKLNSSGLLKPEFVAEYLKNKDKKEMRKENIITLVSILGAVALIVVIAGFLGLNDVFIQRQSAAIAKRTIDSQKVSTQKTQIIAGQTTHWIKTVPIAAIAKGKNFIQLPKAATNVVVKAVSVKPTIQQTKITDSDRKSLLALVKNTKPAAQNNGQNFLADISAVVWKTFVADLSSVVDQIIPPESATDQSISDIAQTPDATVVDVSGVAQEAVAPAEQPVETPPPAEVVTPPAEVTTPAETTVPAEQTPAEQTAEPAQFVQVEYDTPAPEITKQDTSTGQLVTVSAPASSETPDQPLTDVLAFTSIPKIFKVGEESKIKLKWKTNGDQNVTFHAQDTNGDGYLDYVEWTVPHLSPQVFEFIYISKAFQLNSDQTVAADIYDTVKTQDQNYASVTDGQYVRFTFDSQLTNINDITVYAKPTNSGSPVLMQLYPVYTDADGNQTEGPQLATVSDGTNPDFSNINANGKYRILLQNLATPTDVFDLKIAGNVDIDYIVDPTAWTITISTSDSGGSWSGGSPDTYTCTVGTSCTIALSTLQTKLSNANVVIDGQSSQSISVSTAVSWSSGSSLTLSANQRIDISNNITNGGSNAGLVFSGALHIYLHADVAIDMSIGAGGPINFNSIPIDDSNSAGTDSFALTLGNSSPVLPAIGQTSALKNLTLTLLGTCAPTLGGNISITGNFAFSGSGSQSLDVTTNNYAITVGGSWSGATGFVPRGGTVTFNGDTSGQTINSTSSFNTVTINSSTGNGAWTVVTNSFYANTLNVTKGTFNEGAVYLGTTVSPVSININGGTMNANGASVGAQDINISSGTFTAGSNYIYLAGNWTHSGGTFNTGTSSVALTGTNQKIFGSTTFYTFAKSPSAYSASTLYFQQGQTQTISGSGSVLALQGTDTKTLTLRGCDGSGNPTSGDPKWGLNVGASSNIYVDYVDVKDSDASAGKAIAQTNSTDSGNNLNWELDSTPPTASITNPPVRNAYYNATSWANLGPTVFSDNVGGSGLAECRYCMWAWPVGGWADMLSDTTWCMDVNCDGSTPFSSLTTTNNSALQACVAAKDNAGNISAITCYPGADGGFTYDTTAPSDVVVTVRPYDNSWGPGNLSNTNRYLNNDWRFFEAPPVPSFSGTAFLDGSYAGRIVLDGPDGFHLTGPLVDDSGALVYPLQNISDNGGADGSYTVQVCISDQAGNEGCSSGSDTFTYDTHAPDAPTITNLTDGASYSTAVSQDSPTYLPSRLDISCNDSGSSCDQSACELGINYGGSGYSYSPCGNSLNLSEANGISMIVKEWDMAGNGPTESTPITINYDNTPPELSMTSGPVDGGYYNNSTWPRVTIGCTDSNGCTNCTAYYDGSPSNYLDNGNCGGDSSNQPVSLPADGPHTLAFQEQDNAGNWAIVSPGITFNIDNTAPTLSWPTSNAVQNGGTYNDSNWPWVSVNCDDGTGSGCSTEAYACGIYDSNNNNVGACGSGSGAWKPSLDGEYTISARQVDKAGNKGYTDSQLGGPGPITFTYSNPPAGGAVGDACSGGSPCATGFACGTDGFCGGVGAACSIDDDCNLDAGLLCVSGVCSDVSGGSDVSAPTNVGIASVVANSATQLTVTADTATDDTPPISYQFLRNGITASAWQSSTSYVASGLSANTSYSYQVKAKDSLDNANASYSSAVSKYTLANAPGTPTLTVDSASQITAVWSDGSNPTGTEYLATNTTTSANSGWVADLASWPSSDLECSTSYTFTIKARNGNSVETATTTATATTSACPSSGGGGMPASAYLPPSPPAGGFAVQINNGAATTTSQDVTLNLTGSSDVLRMSVSNNPDFANATQEPYAITKQWKLSDGQGQKTVYVKFFSAYGVASQVVTAGINYQQQNILNPIINTIIPPQVAIPSAPTPLPKLPPAATVVKTVPTSLSGAWNILPTKPVGILAAQTVPQALKNLSGAPSVINVGNLAGTNLNLPGLGNLDLTVSAKIPTDVIFIKTANGLIEQGTTLTVGENGAVQQQVETVAGTQLQLIIKPTKPTKAIEGYLIFKQNGAKSQVGLKQALVVAKFSYANLNNAGVWEANVLAPVVAGQYEIINVINYQDPKLQPKELHLTTVIDPEGYVYYRSIGGETRVKNAKVSLFWLNSKTNKYEIWPANNYQQTNPQITDATGKYSFLVPSGTYYLQVRASWYQNYKSQPFQVLEGKGIHQNIELQKNLWLF